MTPDLTLDELGWLLGLAAERRKKREQSLERARRKPGQSNSDFEAGRAKIERALNWAGTVEDHLIRIIGDRDQTRLRFHQQARYEEMLRLKAIA